MKTNMETEIFSQTKVIKDLREKYIKNGKINFNIDFNFEEIKFIASGSSYNAVRLGYKFFENYTSKRISFEYASEFISNLNKKIKKDTLYCFMSQSGETFDTKCALEIVKKEGGKTLAFVNNSDSAIYNLADYKADMLAGVENSIAATKSFLSGVLCLWFFALMYSGKNTETEISNGLREACLAVENVLSDTASIKKIGKNLSTKEKLSIIGYNYGYILAKELALKIKETSYIDTTAYPTGEFLHGHTAILNTNKTLIEIFTDNMIPFEENTLRKIRQDFDPEIVAITDKETELKNVIKFGKYKTEIAKICAITVILQLLALEIAKSKGCDADKPIGLNKVVRG